MALWTFAALAVSASSAFIVTSRVLTRPASAGHETRAAPARYSYAFLLFMLPHSLITVSLVTALFTRMSQRGARRRPGEVVGTSAAACG